MLDLCCGIGQFAIIAEQRIDFQRAHAWDRCGRYIEWLKFAHPHIHAARVDVNEAGWVPPNSPQMDLIVWSEAAEHVFYPRLVLERVAGLLRTDGILFFSIQSAGGPLPVRPAETIYATEDAVRQACESVGLTVRKLEPNAGRYWVVAERRIEMFALLLCASAVGQAAVAPAPADQIARVLSFCAVDQDHVVVDLGAADGRLLIGAAQLGARAIGYATAEAAAAAARRQIAEDAWQRGRPTPLVVVEDLAQADLDGATLIYADLPKDALEGLVGRLRRLPDTVMIVSYQRRLPGIRHQVILISTDAAGGEHYLYYYRTPLEPVRDVAVKDWL